MKEKSNNVSTMQVTKALNKEMLGGHELKLTHREVDSFLEIVAPNGDVSLSIIITSDGPVLDFGNSSVKIASQGTIKIDAENLELNARKNLSLSSGGDVKINAEGSFDSQANIQNIKAKLGNVNLKANDDVKLRGERILLNK